MSSQMRKPRMSLERYLTKKYEALCSKYKKLASAMGDCNVHEIYQFRKGIERIAAEEIEKLIEEVYVFWGQIEVDNSARKLEINSWSFAGRIWAAAHQAHIAERVNFYRANYGPENPLPTMRLSKS